MATLSGDVDGTQSLRVIAATNELIEAVAEALTAGAREQTSPDFLELPDAVDELERRLQDDRNGLMPSQDATGNRSFGTRAAPCWVMGTPSERSRRRRNSAPSSTIAVGC